jgi:hypothetical protein
MMSVSVSVWLFYAVCHGDDSNDDLMHKCEDQKRY